MPFEFPTRRRYLPVSRVLTVAALLVAFNTGSFAQNQPQPQPQPAPPATTRPATKAGDAVVQPASKVVLVYRAQTGQTRRGRGVANLTLSPGGNKVTLDIRETNKQTYTKVAPNGDITFDETTEATETLINGQKSDTPDEKKETSTTTIHPNGALVAYSSTKNDKDDAKFQGRLFYATNPIFSDKPVGPGDKWSIDVKANDDLGVHAAKVDYEVLEAKKINDVDTVNIKFTFAETGSGGLTSHGTVLVEASSGDTLASDIDIDGVPLGPPGQESPATGKLLSERLEGGPMPGAKNIASGKTEKKDKTIDETVKDFEKLPGLLTLYRKKDSGRETIYLEIPEAKFGKPYFLQATASTGTADEVIAGDELNDIVFKFNKTPDDKILIVAPNWSFQADPSTPIGKAVKRSFADGYLQSFRIEAKQPDRKSVLIDISDLFRSDFAQITQALSGSDGLAGLLGLGGGGGFGLDREKTYIQSMKNFPENLVVSTQYHFFRGRASGDSSLADPRSLPLIVSYNLSELPNDENYKPTNGYVPRTADPRIGYFETDYLDFTDDTREDFTNRYIARWDLRKKDPTAALSEPVKPIVFWLDNAIPYQYRDVVKNAILVWNRAFEKIGFKDAIQVQQMPDNADFDHADLRYNVVRWVVTPPGAPRNGVAIGLSRVNPLTGQILNAGVTIDAEWTHYPRIVHRNLIDPAAKFREGANQDIEDVLSGNAPLTNELKEELIPSKHNRFSRYCQISDGLEEKAAFGLMALDLLSPDGVTPEQEKHYTDEMLQETVTHEVGHVLGLRHNFIASTEFTLNQLQDAALVKDQGIGASVMDYNNFNISAIGHPGVDYFSQTVGTYDIWAIAYGYTPFSPAEEANGLKQIASQSNLPGHAYEEDLTCRIGLDPRVVQYDMSSQPLDYWERMLQLSRKLMMSLDAREPKPGESYWEFTKRLNMLLGNYARSAGTASKYIGGILLNRNHKGDPNEQPNTISIDAADQKRALGLLNRYIFAPDALVLPTRDYSHLTSDPFPTADTIAFTIQQDQPIGDQIASIQTAALKRIFAPSVLRRLQNAEFKADNPQKVLTLPFLFSSVRDNIWADIKPAPAKPATATIAKTEVIKVPLLRRQLQRAYLDTMIDMATKPGSAPDDAKMLAWDQLRQIKSRLVAVQAAQVQGDEYTRLHLRDSLDKINRALDAKLTLGAPPASNSSSLLQMLLGGKQN
jgi:hypothetical protein